MTVENWENKYNYKVISALLHSYKHISDEKSHTSQKSLYFYTKNMFSRYHWQWQHHKTQAALSFDTSRNEIRELGGVAAPHTSRNTNIAKT